MPFFERTKPGDVSSELAEWIRFLNNAKHETEETIMEQCANPNIHKAFRALQALSADEEPRQLAEMRERALSDEVSELNGARLEGERKGIRRLIVETLKLRFHIVPDKIGEKLKSVEDTDVLGSIHGQSVTAESLEAFEKYISSL